MARVTRGGVWTLFAALTLMSSGLLGAPAIAAPAPNACTNPANFAGGTGTPADPFEVATADQLAQIADTTCMDSSFLQTADIDLTGVAWSEIGTWVPYDPFGGTYDGGGFEIANLTFNDTSDPGGNQVGLFGRTEGATLADIHLVDASVTGWDAVGSLVGVANSTTITDCTSVNATVVGGGAFFFTAGGFAGVIETNSRVSDSSVTGRVDGVSRIGGFVGANLDGATITDSTADVTVVGGQWTGGFAGHNDVSTLESVSATGSVSGGPLTGGLVGVAAGGIERSRATGAVTGTNTVGGLVGLAQLGAVISESSASGDVLASADAAGGLVGVTVSVGTTVRRSWASGDVTAAAATSAGGFVGVIGSDSSVVDSYATGAVTGPKAGGFAGTIESTGSASRSYAVGAVTATKAGGFARKSSGTVNHSFFDRQTTGTDSGPGTGLTTARMTTITAFEQAGWAIVQDWRTSSPPTRVWGICPTINDGYPYLLWSRMSDDCPLAPSITSANPGTALDGLPYRFRITASGYPAPTYAISSGTLPAGLVLNTTTGVVSGIPTVTGTQRIVVRAQNASGHDDVAVDVVVDDLVPRAPRSVALLESVGTGDVLVQTPDAVLKSRVATDRTTVHISSTGPFGRAAVMTVGASRDGLPIDLEHGRRTCILTPGGTVTIDASGFLPGAVVGVYADPGAVGGRSARAARPWGRLVADASGRVRGSVDVLGGAGARVVQIVGASDRNVLRAVSLGVLVDDVPRQVRDLTATRTGGESATLTWQSPRGLEVAARAVVQLRVGVAGYVRVPTGSAYALTQADITGLRAGCRYDARVRVVSPLGAGPWSTVVISASRGRMAPSGDVTCELLR